MSKRVVVPWLSPTNNSYSFLRMRRMRKGDAGFQQQHVLIPSLPTTVWMWEQANRSTRVTPLIPLHTAATL